ncbi:toxin-activating lysine-acyltransferase [Pseudomonas sp. GL-RE-26]|uniref:toxin-activating lysine-acyltransferase n=1 Tax=Pseudomonas sp. GL-RE-26 TaxID=2832390 RepID=UPI001CBF098D|nr:toxin-activating lysine-acyltransferase [Pseudomonas sp. GL-RE-26]
MKKFSELYTSCRYDHSPNRAKLIGFACLIILMCRHYSLFQIMTLRFWIAPAIDHKQILFFFDNFDMPVGYVTWAHLAPDSELRLLQDPDFLLHTSEWNEGGKTWIVDFCFPVGGTAIAIKHLKKHFRELGINKVFWGRRNRDHSVRRVGSYSIVMEE